MRQCRTIAEKTICSKVIEINVSGKCLKFKRIERVPKYSHCEHELGVFIIKDLFWMVLG